MLGQKYQIFNIFLFITFLTEYAREIVTAKGSPSGIATTSTVIPSVTKCRKSFK